MKMKKIIAGAVASAMAVSAMAVAASAALLTKTGNTESAALYDVSFEGLTEDQIKSITKIEAKVSVTSDMVNGCIGYNDAASGWTSANQELKADAGPTEGTWVLEVAAGSFAALDDTGAIAPFAQVQFWWVNPIYDEAGNEGDAGVATLESVTLYDASGNVVTAGSGDASGDNNTPATDNNTPATDSNTTGTDNQPAGDTNQTTPDKNSPDTGVEGVAVVAGLAIIAAGAVVVAKKRK